jgi:diguanylate cyclase (GGDEF)-like protein
VLAYPADVSTAAPQLRGESIAARVSAAPRVIWAAYGLMGALLLSYFASLLVRSPDQSLPLIDGWGVAAFELVGSALCIARAFGSRRGRSIPLILGLGVLSWSIGDTLLTAESAGGATPPVPSIADLFWLGFYPIVYVGLVLLMRRHIRKLVPATWLDGAVAGLGAAGVCACFAFNTILHSVGGDAVTVATDLAYPIGDVLLLILVVGGTAIIPGRRNPQWLLLAAAVAINAIGDTFNLFASSGSTTHLGTIFNGIAWPASILLISISVWLRPGRFNPLAPQKTAGFLLPGLGAFAGLAILFVGTVHRVTPVAIGLATATLMTVGIRFGLSVRRLRSLTEKRHRQAITDELTGLGNRRHLFYLLNAFFADHADPRTADRQLSLLFVDLDHFKEINDSFGHAAGDELLRQLGPRLEGCLRDTDVLVRVGGDELAVIIMDTDPAYAAAVAQRVVDKLEEPFVLDSVSVRISASIGIASAPADATDSTGLLRCADLAMYRAKLGPSSFEAYRHDIDDGGNRLRLVEDLRVAVEGGVFDLHYQPQVDLRTGEVSAVEALLRWSHPRLGAIPPLEFLPLAEEAGLMRSLTAHVIDQALTQCAVWHTGGRPLTVSVNISVTNLLDPGFLDSVRALLARHRLPASSLTLEITETTIIRDFAACKLAIARLRDLGLAVSIDDFGAGFTSLAYLGSLAVSELKLDRTFITRLANGDKGRDLALVRATIDLGHALQMRVVAEGVEDRATLDLLTSVGCDVAQGYFISRPMPARDLALPAPRFRVVPQPAAAVAG